MEEKTHIKLVVLMPRQRHILVFIKIKTMFIT